MAFLHRRDMTPGQQLRKAIKTSSCLQIFGCINAYCALLAESAGAKAIYLSGAGVANASLGLPDLAVTTSADVVTEIERISRVSRLPLLVDIDTGWGHTLNVMRSVNDCERAGAAGVHIEDQVATKRCGHRPNKSLVSVDEMGERLSSALEARHDPSFVIMARTDAIASEGLAAAVARAEHYVAQGADMIFAEACCSLDELRTFSQTLHVPVLANITEFGRTPLFTVEELAAVGVACALYPLSAFRAMSQAALTVYKTTIEQGSQATQLSTMQTRDALYEILAYHQHEQRLDKFKT